jgi:hypothetical protein
MQRYRAILVDFTTSQPLCGDWTPTILPDEIEEANQRLQQQQSCYRWRWLDRVTTLHGSVTMHAAAHNAVS